MPDHELPRTERLALYMRERAGDKAARDSAVRVVERWNAELASGSGALWSPTIRSRPPLARCALPRLRNQLRDRIPGALRLPYQPVALGFKELTPYWPGA